MRLCRREQERGLTDLHFDWLEEKDVQRKLHSLAVDHGVHGLVLWTLGCSDLRTGIGPAFRKALLELIPPLRRQSFLWDMELDRLLTQLGKRELLPVVLKGAALRFMVYTDPVQRQLGDLDLLLPRDRIDDAVETLQACGYASPYSEAADKDYFRHHFHIRLAHRLGFVVEVHWGLIRPDAPFALDAGSFLRRSRIFQRPSGPEIHVPSLEDMVLHAASQNLEDTFRLRRLVDIDRLIASSHEFDWDYLEKSAKLGELQVVLALCLEFCEQLLGTPIPAGFTRMLRVSRLTRVHLALVQPVESLFSQQTNRPGASTIRNLWLIAGWRSRLKKVAQIFVGAEDPLKWIWVGGDRSPERTSAPLRGIASVLRLIALQLRLYGRAARTGFRPTAGRRSPL